MAKTAVNVMEMISRKGIDPQKPHIGIVVDDMDPEQMCRVQIRIPLLFDGIKDEDLPWAIPEDNAHNRGLKGSGLGRAATLLGVPKKGNRVAVYFKHGGDPQLPSYSHKLPFDKQTIPPEFLENYPNRLGEILPSGFFFVYDDKTGELFLTVPGDTHLTVYGDVHQRVVGNMQFTVKKEDPGIPSYLKDSVSDLYEKLTKNQQKRVQFDGRLDKESGNLHFEVEGDLTGNVGGNYDFNITKNTKIKTGANTDISSGGSTTIDGQRVDIA